jgi:hypothetical protein
MRSVTRLVCEKIAQMLPKPFAGESWIKVAKKEKKWPLFHFQNYTQNKLSPNGRKFASYGHPGYFMHEPRL